MPKAQEIEAAMQPTKPGAGHKKERRFTVYKPTRVEREEEEQAEAEVGVNILLLKICIFLLSISIYKSRFPFVRVSSVTLQ